MSTYEIHEGNEYYDENEGDSRGNPVKKWHSSGGSFDSHHRPKVGESWIFEENGKLYQRTVKAVHSNGAVWEDVESLDVEYSTAEIKPDEFVVDKKEVGWGSFKYGVVSGLMEVVVPYEYYEIQPCSYPMGYIVKVRKGDKWGVIDCKKREVMVPVEYEQVVMLTTSRYHTKYWMCCKDGKWSLFDVDFNKTVPDEKDFVVLQQVEGYSIIAGGDQCMVGMVDSNQDIVIPFFYVSIHPDENRLLHVVKKDIGSDEKHYLFDFHGKEITGPYRSISNPKDGAYSTTSCRGLKGLVQVEENGEVTVVPAIYESVPEFVDGMCESTIKVEYEDGVFYHREKHCVDVIVRHDIKGNYAIPEGTVQIYPSQFAHNQHLRTLYVPESVLTIGEKAFDYCLSLKEVNIPKSVEVINSRTFTGCKALRSIDVPGSVTTVGDLAFIGCSSLKTVIIQEGVKFIEEAAFSGCESLESIQLPESIQRLGEGVFSFCRKLKKVNIPKAVKAIKNASFSCCESLETIEIDVEDVGVKAFSACKSLKEVTFSKRVRSIYGDAFYNCISLVEVFIPETVEFLGPKAFYGCTNLKSVTLKKELYNEKWHQFPEWTMIHFIDD